LEFAWEQSIKKWKSIWWTAVTLIIKYIEYLMFVFPELLLVILSITLLVGRYTGYRLLEPEASARAISPNPTFVLLTISDTCGSKVKKNPKKKEIANASNIPKTFAFMALYPNVSKKHLYRSPPCEKLCYRGNTFINQ